VSCIPAAMVLSADVTHGSVPVSSRSVPVARLSELELGLELVEGAVKDTTLAAVCVNNVSTLSVGTDGPFAARFTGSMSFVGTV